MYSKYDLRTDTQTCVTGIQFSILTEEEVRRLSVCEVTETTLYYRGLPATGGLLDPLMGTIDRRHLCATCMCDAQQCQGHPGHISLPFPVYHIGFVDTVLKILRSTCFFCSRVCLTEEEAETCSSLPLRQRISYASSVVKGKKTCPFCSAPHPSYVRTPLSIRADWPADTQWESKEEEEYCRRVFTARDALSILSNMQEEDISLLGMDPTLSHPKNMILRNILIPPPSSRPAVYSSEGSRSRGQNELTVRYLEILRRAQEVRACVSTSSSWETVPMTEELLEKVARLQYEVYMLVNNNTRIPRPAGMGRGGGGANHVKSLTDRLKGKEGRVRGNLMGKRVDFSARCVITPDAYFDCDRVGVPISIALKLTVPETVTVTNIASLADRVRRGAGDVRGADTVFLCNGGKVSLSCCKDRESITLQPGDVVERYLQDEDVVVFNRQPSLHMHGMQAHRVRLMPGHTFRLSLTVAAPYNADFDGDEMNIHVPQSKAASAECATLMAVTQNCLSSQSNKPVMGVVQDSLLAMYLLTEAGVLLSHAHSCRILGSLCGSDVRLPPACARRRDVDGKETGHMWTGKQIFSVLLPPSMFLQHGGSFPSSTGTDAAGDAWRDASLPVVVRRGRLLCGRLSKSTLGTSAGGLIDTITREEGGVSSLRVMAEVQRMGNAYLLIRSHHVGVCDVLLSKEGQLLVTQRLEKASRLCEEIEREVAQTTEEDMIQRAEGGILRLLSKMLLQTGGVVDEKMGKENAIRAMVNAGSKGSFINLSQICACLGQQSLEGQRIRSQKKGERTLPFYLDGSVHLPSRGMVFNSFALGLSPTELFYHGVGGREGLVDTAVKTSQTGYLQRRMNKGMEDHTVHGDGTVRMATGDVISFSWGGDGMDPSRMERIKLPFIHASSPGNSLTEREEVLVEAARRVVLSCKTGPLLADMDSRGLLPFHPERLRKKMVVEEQSRGTLSLSSTKREEDVVVDSEEVWTWLRRMCDRSPSAMVLGLVRAFQQSFTSGMRRRTVRLAMQEVEERVTVARCVEGKSVGCIAAQSIGQPATQLTLNTFHLAGCATKNVTLGIPRLKELLDVSQSCKTPCLTLRFRNPFSSSEEFAEYMSNTLPLTRLADVVLHSSVLYQKDEDVLPSHPDQWMIRSARLLLPPEQKEEDRGGSDLSPFLLRIELNQDLMRARCLTPPMLRSMLAKRLRGRAQVLSSETNSVEWVLRVRLRQVGEMISSCGLAQEQEGILCHHVLNLVLDTVVVGGNTSVTSASRGEAQVFCPVTGETKGTEQVVHVYGSFLTDCVCSHAVEWERCISNDVYETFLILGVEAACHVLFSQIKAVVSFDGTYVDDRHILVVVDTMCRSGFLMPLNRHGINRTDTSPLMKASFEETADVIFEAGMHFQSENARGVSASVMTGQLSHMGTGSVSALFHSEALPYETWMKHMQKDMQENMLSHGGVAGTDRDSGGGRRKVLWSTCRSFPQKDLPEVLEYQTNNVVPVLSRPLSPPVSGNRKRSRFRCVSPSEEKGEK